ncbi:LysR family transcriptional regulator [Microvirga puerhi]|uniref:LysR family transcriptional regulator n=1 Tax=Microvirga puerhi TaxID=2876078 RepID=A0ABS7VK25_9HYPH|nr:LysR family transcriptional regulator [Microvirga puerhi]MBZ6075888.1 LysR family transcriptional regulator [Microvirga puerhi]
MDTRFLESFLTVAESGSMAEAARRLGITPAAVAQRIRALEDEVGTLLLSRAGRTVRPTEAGSAILARGRNILRDVRDLQALAGRGSIAGEIRLGAISTALTGLLPTILARLLAAAPMLDLYVVPGTSVELYRQVTEGDIDAAIVVKPQFAFPKTLDWHVLRSEPLIVLAPERIADRDPHSLLRSEPFIRYDRNHWGGRLADSYLRRVGIRPHERLELDALEAIAVMVSKGLGVSLLPDWAPPWPAGLSVAKIALPANAPERHIGLVWSRASSRIRLIQALQTVASQVSMDPIAG